MSHPSVVACPALPCPPKVEIRPSSSPTLSTPNQESVHSSLTQVPNNTLGQLSTSISLALPRASRPGILVNGTLPNATKREREAEPSPNLSAAAVGCTPHGPLISSPGTRPYLHHHQLAPAPPACVLFDLRGLVLVTCQRLIVPGSMVRGPCELSPSFPNQAVLPSDRRGGYLRLGLLSVSGCQDRGSRGWQWAVTVIASSKQHRR